MYPAKWGVSHNLMSGTFSVARTWYVRADGKVSVARVQWYGRPRKVFELRTEAEAVAARENAK